MLKIYEQPYAVAAAMEPHIDVSSQVIRLKNVGFGRIPS